MAQFILRRSTFFLFTLLVTSILIFVLTRVLPGDVARVLLGREASEREVESLREELGLNEPLIVQYVDWMRDLVVGDWGNTFSRPRQPIRDAVLYRLGRSGQLGLLTLCITVPLSIFLGVVAALSEGRWPDAIISTLALSVASLPEFVTALVMIHWIANRAHLLPASSSLRPEATFTEALPALWLPAITASLVLIAYIARLTRAGVIEELKRDYVRTAVLKGLSYPTVIARHVLRNALIPTITVIATSTGWLVSGLVVIEFVYSYPGLGRLLIFAINNRDLPLIQAITMITVVVILVANFAADLLYALLNPRISFS